MDYSIISPNKLQTILGRSGNHLAAGVQATCLDRRCPSDFIQYYFITRWCNLVLLARNDGELVVSRSKKQELTIETCSFSKQHAQKDPTANSYFVCEPRNNYAYSYTSSDEEQKDKCGVQVRLLPRPWLLIQPILQLIVPLWPHLCAGRL